MAVETQQKHLLILEDNQGRKEFSLEKSVYSIGRQSDCDIRLFSHFVSRHHATLVRREHEDGSYYYRIVDGDLNGKPSANGLLINGRKLHAHDLQDEDEIVFGPQVRAVYYLVNPDSLAIESTDEWDVTLTSANTSEELEEIHYLEGSP